MYSAIFTPYITCMISGVPNPFAAMWRAIGTIRSARVTLAPLGDVDDGQVGLDEPHCSSFGVPGGGDEETTRTDR